MSFQLDWNINIITLENYQNADVTLKIAFPAIQAKINNWKCVSRTLEHSFNQAFNIILKAGVGVSR